MKKAVQVFAMIGVVIGSFAILGSLKPLDGYGLLGGGLFLAWGIVDLKFLSYLGKE